jgi:hypothetical protein
MAYKKEPYQPTDPTAYNRLFKRMRTEVNLLYKEVYGELPDEDYYMCANMEQLGKAADNLGKRLAIYVKDYE